ncbi:hypothetical protein COT86_01575 [Candidatus Collierbacteria bacterium CG10_big_fil_rev_8_21_14_0_10_43_36]|nr:hypothetical protein [bacterium]PIR99898.1 MAG: hypothetical protein COT86_01575 [Candidatus Collierbacteria bacterium CG10_big_fil_rev_8_21_14_0_10_43_36]PJB47113.1 MAG: hypothetical protein CO104_04595 [Candidatus Collierbacteria bacterium CG_4_9_14_3_um_filter_43_16]
MIKQQFFAIWNTIRDTISPLPDPKDPVWVEIPRRYSEFLTKNQIIEIRTLILDEARISRELGLFIRPKDLDHEIRLWLVFINWLAGPKTIAEKFTLELFQEFTTGLFEQEFANSNNAFLLHLETVRTRIIHAIFNGELTADNG